MGDSDDDYDRRRARDKFRRERSDYQERHGEDRGRRDDYVDSRRDMWTRDRGRRDFRDVDLRRRERYSPPRHDISPPMKKIRRNWDDHGYGSYEVGGYSGSSMIGSHQSWSNTGADVGGNIHSQHNYGGPGSGSSGAGPGGHRDMDMCPTQPPMMTFKQFLASQDDSIGDEEAVRKYNDYKLEFRRQQLNEFFLSHKEEEWFKSKYQPEECARRKQEQLSALNRRIEVFFELLDNGWVESTAVDADKADAIIRFLDAVVIKLEGGSDSDLKVLDESPVEQEKHDKTVFQSFGASVSTGFTKEDRKNNAGENKSANPDKVKGEDSSESDWDKEIDEDSGKQNSATSSNCGEKNEPEANIDDEVKETSKDELQEEEEEKDEIKSEEESTGSKVHTEKSVDVEKSPVVAPRPLHKTCSIFLRNLAPSITKQEVEGICRRYKGFLRVAIADPQPDRRFFRRGWVTFERGVNIKDYCWQLNNIRLRDCELGAIVNRDLTRRIRSCNGIAAHKQVVRADIKLVAKVIQTLDKRHELWTEEKENDGNGQLGFGLISRNPLLKNITDYLIEEADAEEEELLGKSSADDVKKEGEGAETTVERDEALIKVLDRLLLYLRIVHSLDYYNHSDYPNEDEMPNRCGIMHARGCAPSLKVTQNDINDYINNFEGKMTPFLQPLTKLTDDESVKLGKKDSLVEVEKFIMANTQELGKDKWLCPLSGKKFKGPEFVRKHIFNKHCEKVEEVKKEVEFFNNYLLDPKRPQLPEHPGSRSARGESGSRSDGFTQPSTGYQPPPPYSFGYGQGYRMPANQGSYSSSYGVGRGSYNDNYRSGAGFYAQKRGGGRNRGDPREIIGYHDLDAPEDLDVF